MARLWNDFLTNDQRLIHKWRWCFPVYEKHLGRFVDQSVKMLEIGCGSGGSLQMWKRYLGPHARIVGIDKQPDRSKFAEEQITIHIGDQGDPDFLRSVDKKYGGFDIILDDGSHQMAHMRTSFDALYPRLTQAGGVYMVEDMHCCYWPAENGYGDGPMSSTTFMEHCKHLIDQMHAEDTKGVLEADDFTRTIREISFYRSIVVFTKMRQFNRHMAIKTGLTVEDYEDRQPDSVN